MTDYITPEGERAWYCKTVFIRARQHLSLEGLFPTATACGHPVGDWSNTELRTLVGLTCRTCIRNVTKHGETCPTLFARLMLKFAPLALKLIDRSPEKPSEPISTDELFPEQKTPRRKARPTEEDED
jgi:hypothetical protein